MAVERNRPRAWLTAKLAAGVVALAAAGATVALAVGAVGAQAAQASKAAQSSQIFPTIYVQYTLQCTFTLENDQGAPITQIPPGVYQVQVDTPILFRTVNTTDQSANDYTGCKGYVQFQLTGPGVNLATTLDVGCEDAETLPATNFAPSSTFVAIDNNNPSGTRTTFTTAATGTPTAPTSNAGHLNTSTTEQSGGTSPVGSNLSKEHHLGALLSKNGAVELISAAGRRVQQVAQGDGVILVKDQDPKASFYIQQNGSPPIRLTPPKFVGIKRKVVYFTPGIWKYYSSQSSAYTFIVIG